MENRKAETYNKIIGVTKDKSIIVLNELFEYSNDFRGATGYIMGVLTQEEIDEQLNDTEIYRDLWQQAVADGATELSLDDYVDELKEDLEGDTDRYFLYDDPSFRYETDKGYEQLTDEQKAQFDKIIGKKGEDFMDWSCNSCGRCFGHYMDESEYELLFEPQLLAKIKQYEQLDKKGDK